MRMHAETPTALGDFTKRESQVSSGERSVKVRNRI